jgi:uncharacterized protein YukE
MSALKQEVEQAVVQIRAADASLVRSINVLAEAGVWTGSDARAFQTEWSDQVHRNIVLAGNILESLTFIPAV